MIALQSGDGMVEENHILIGAIRKLALAGEQSGFSVEEIIELLKTGVSVVTVNAPKQLTSIRHRNQPMGDQETTH